MYKVICPMEKSDGGTWWLRCGNGFRNKDDSLNLYINCLPTNMKGGELKLQVRELTEEDLRHNAEKRASYSSSPSRAATASGPGSASLSAQDSIPF
jgi:hypothetical protein